MGHAAGRRRSTEREFGSRVRCGWADLGLSHLSGAPANTSRAGKVEAVENTACGVCVGLLLPPLSYFPHCRKYRQSIHP